MNVFLYNMDGLALSVSPWIYWVFDSELSFGHYTFKNLFTVARYVLIPVLILHDLVWGRDAKFYKLRGFLLIIPFMWKAWRDGVQQIGYKAVIKVHNSEAVRGIWFYVIYMGMSFACMPVYHVHASCVQRREEGVGCPGTGVTANCEPPWGSWESSPGRLEKQP